MNGKREKQVNERKEKQGKQFTRREALRALGAATALVPAASLLWEGGVRAAVPQKNKKGQEIGQLIDKALTDPEFRKALKARPAEVLAQAGIELPTEIAEALTKAMKQGSHDPNKLIRAVLGEPSPLITDLSALSLSSEEDIIVAVFVVISAAIYVIAKIVPPIEP